MLSREGRQYVEMAPRLAMWPQLRLAMPHFADRFAGRIGTGDTG